MKYLVVIFIVLIAIGAIAWAYQPFPQGSATLDFPNTAAGTSSDLTLTVSTAKDGDPIMLAVPNGSTVSNGVFTAWISADNTATVRFTNNSLLAALNPASGTFVVMICKR